MIFDTAFHKNTEKKDLKKDFFELMNNIVKMLENRNIKLVTKDKRKHYVVSEYIYHIMQSFLGKLFATEMKKTKVMINKPVYLGYFNS